MYHVLHAVHRSVNIKCNSCFRMMAKLTPGVSVPGTDVTRRTGGVYSKLFSRVATCVPGMSFSFPAIVFMAILPVRSEFGQPLEPQVFIMFTMSQSFYNIGKLPHGVYAMAYTILN